MAGILDKKQRIMDTLILNPGRYQAGRGHMQFRYVTFTDRNAFYDVAPAPTASNVADDASDRIYFESSQRFQDLICLETDLNGMVDFQYTGELFVPDSEFATSEHLYSYFSVSGSFPSGSIINPLVGGLPSEITQGMVKSYKQQQFLATTNPFDRNEQFILSTGSIGFDFNDEIPLGPKSALGGTVTPHELKRNNLKEVWGDARFMHLPNFLFLPPINRLPPGARMERVLPFLVTNLPLPQLNFEQAKDSLKVWMGDEWGKSAINSITPGGSSYKLVPGNPGLVTTEMSDAPSVMLQTAIKYSGDYAQVLGKSLFGWQSSLDPSSWIAAAFDQIDINDFAAARLAFMGSYNPTLLTKYGNKITTLDKAMEKLAAKVTSGDKGTADYNYNAIIGDVVTFPETSQDNNLLIQIFEFPEVENRINKLTIIDTGELADGNAHGPNHRLFYVGKMYKNDVGNLCFANIFTIIMHNSSFAAEQGEKWFGFALKDPKNKFSMTEF